MEAHGSPTAKFAQQAAGLLPDAIQRTFMQKVGVDRLAALLLAIDVARPAGQSHWSVCTAAWPIRCRC